MAEYRLGIYEKAMPDNFSLEEKLLLAQKVGFDYVELSVDETEARLRRLDFSKEKREALHSFMVQQGIFFETMCLSAHRKYPLGSECSETRQKGLEIMEKAILLARDLGIRIIQLAGYDVYYEESNERTKKYFEQALERCVCLASEFGVILAFENMETDFMNTVEKAKRVVDKIQSPYLQIYPDIGNICNATKDYIGDIRTGKGYIAAAHLKETAEHIFRDMEYGQGQVDFQVCIQRLISQGVCRFTCEFWYDGITEPELYVKRNYEYIRGCFPDEAISFGS